MNYRNPLHNCRGSVVGSTFSYRTATVMERILIQNRDSYGADSHTEPRQLWSGSTVKWLRYFNYFKKICM